MCVRIVKKAYSPPRKRKVIGWKRFNKRNNRYFGPYFQGSGYEVGKVYQSSEDSIPFPNASSATRYPAGFHAWKSRSLARLDVYTAGVVKKVALWDTVVEGLQWPGEVIVARKMKILEK